MAQVGNYGNYATPNICFTLAPSLKMTAVARGTPHLLCTCVFGHTPMGQAHGPLSRIGDSAAGENSARGSTICVANQSCQPPCVQETSSPEDERNLPHCPLCTVPTANIRPIHSLHRTEFKDICSARTHAKHRDANKGGLQPGRVEWSGTTNSMLALLGQKRRLTETEIHSHSHGIQRHTRTSTSRRVEYYARRDPARRSPSAAEEQSTMRFTFTRLANSDVGATALAARLSVHGCDLNCLFFLMSTKSDTGPECRQYFRKLKENTTDITNSMQTSRRPTTCIRPRRLALTPVTEV